MSSSVVLLSGGLDSTVNFYQAALSGEVLLALTFDYHQRAAKKEILAARKISKKFRVPHQVVKLPFFQKLGGSSLVDRKKKVPDGRAVQIDDLKASQASAKSVWVPNRNGIFLNIAAGFAEALKAELVIPGFNLEEATTFPDNSRSFLESLDQSFSFSTGNNVKTHCYTTDLKKPEIVELGKSLGVDWSSIWPCYHAGPKWCGECESCKRSKRAFEAVKVDVSRLFQPSKTKR